MERQEDGQVHHRVAWLVSLVDQWCRPVWPGARWAGLPRLSPSPVPLPCHTQLHQHTRPPPCDQRVIAGKRPGCSQAANQAGVSPTYQNYCQPATGTASANCRPGTGTKVSMINRNRTQRGLLHRESDAADSGGYIRTKEPDLPGAPLRNRTVDLLVTISTARALQALCLRR